MAAVVILAYDERQGIGQLLRQIAPLSSSPDLEVIVVAPAGGEAAEIASSFGLPVRVVTVAGAARPPMREGDEAATSFPRVYLDAGAEIGTPDLLALMAEAATPGVLAAIPRLALALGGSPRAVRWYCEVYLRLPEVRRGPLGRGVIALSEDGHRRLSGLLPLLAFDLAASLAFAPAERRVVQAAIMTGRVPDSLAGLVRGRIEAAAALAGLERSRRLPRSRAWTRPADLAGVVRDDPLMAPKVALFAVVTVIAKLAARLAARPG